MLPESGSQSSNNTSFNVEALKDLCSNNADYFVDDNSENGQRLHISFVAIKEATDKLEKLMNTINGFADQYDFDSATPGNGYRSFVAVAESALLYGIHINKKVCLKRSSVLFRKSSIAKEVEACSQLFVSLECCLEHLLEVRKNSPEGSLFATNHENPQGFIAATENVNQYCFYGRPLGFQFADSMKGPLRFISLSMAIFSEAYYNNGSILSKATSSVMNTGRFVSDPEQRAKRIVNIFKNSDVHFCKAFWFLAESELMHYLPSVVAPSVAISRVINIPTEPLHLTANGKEIEVPIPSSHVGSRPVHVRLISNEPREGMVGEGTNARMQPASRGLLIHCHGGGFVAQSSKSHESYLRQWAKELQVPILSIDYSLAPAAPYPRALEEVLYAYSWALKNCHLLGSTGERIVAAGDSAGANLLACMSLKCIDLGITPPHGLFLAYAPTFVNFVPSPARLLSKMDLLLPFGFLVRCLMAYVVPPLEGLQEFCQGRQLSPDTESFEEISESDLVELQAHKSPTSEMSDTLTYGSLNSQNDDNKNQILQEIESEPDASQKFDLLDKFVLDSDTDTDGTKIAVVTDKNESVHTITPNNESLFNTTIPGKVSSFVNKWKGKMSSFMQMNQSTAAALHLDIETERNIIDEMNYKVPADPHFSPYCASDEVLKRFPKTQILTVHLDPCLDDCVSFAKRLKGLGNNVNLTILDGLPHGFLNFSLVSKEAYEASKLCTQKIENLLDLSSLPPLGN